MLEPSVSVLTRVPVWITSQMSGGGLSQAAMRAGVRVSSGIREADLRPEAPAHITSFSHLWHLCQGSEHRAGSPNEAPLGERLIAGGD